jgi:hypothetical protein
VTEVSAAVVTEVSAAVVTEVSAAVPAEVASGVLNTSVLYQSSSSSSSSFLGGIKNQFSRLLHEHIETTKHTIIKKRRICNGDIFMFFLPNLIFISILFNKYIFST